MLKHRYVLLALMALLYACNSEPSPAEDVPTGETFAAEPQEQASTESDLVTIQLPMGFIADPQTIAARSIGYLKGILEGLEN